MPPICFVPSPCPVNRVKSQSQKQPTAALDSQGYDGSGEKSLPPNRFGRYRLCKALQIGSTSEVYLAEDIYTEVCSSVAVAMSN
jgi:hypothetical protein